MFGSDELSVKIVTVKIALWLRYSGRDRTCLQLQFSCCSTKFLMSFNVMTGPKILYILVEDEVASFDDTCLIKVFLICSCFIYLLNVVLSVYRETWS